MRSHLLQVHARDPNRRAARNSRPLLIGVQYEERSGREAYAHSWLLIYAAKLSLS